MPSLLIVPAWSKSINSFDARLISLADTIHTSALVCNCRPIPTRSNSVHFSPGLDNISHFWQYCLRLGKLLSFDDEILTIVNPMK